jgi:hypothetical protein
MRPVKVLLSLVFGVSNAVYASSAHIDPVVDPKAPPAINELTIPSGDDRMAALIYIANGPGPHPTVVMLHGFPGNEKNLDLAQAIRRSGFNIVFFHYRGAWGSEGTYSLLQIDDDALTVLSYLRQPEVAQRLRVDVDKLSLLGHSMGGFGALSAGHLDDNVVCVGAMSPANLGVYAAGINAEDPAIEGFKAYVDSIFVLRGFDGNVMTQQLTSVPIESLDTTKFGPGLHGKSVFMVIGDQDRVTPAEAMFDPVVKAYSEDKDIRLQHLKISGDHSYSWSRIKLADVVVDWLDKDCR